HYALLSRGTTVSQPILLASFGRENAAFTWADFNGDGRADLLVDENDHQTGRYGHWALLSKGEALEPSRVLRTFGKPGGEPTWSDFNGDGRADLVYGLTGADHSQWALLSTGQDLAPETALGAMGTETGSFHWLDFNADGKQDLAFDEAAAPFRHWVRLSTGKGLAPRTDFGGFACDDGSFHWADWNGDRLPDLACSQKISGGYSHRIRPSNGKTLEAARSLGNHGAGQASFAWLDFNLDGMVDLTWAEPQAGGGATQWVSLSTGEGLRNPLNLGGIQAGGGTFQWADLDGDGLPDFAFNRGTAARPDLQIRLHAGKLPDLLTSATNGLGSTVAVAYRPLSDGAVYASTGTGYPLRNLQAGLYVVAEHSTNDGRENQQTYHFSFEYAGSRLDSRGRGWLGFSRIVATDRQTGTRNDTLYLQEFPFTGLTARTEASSIAGLKLSRSELTYTHNETAPGVWQVLRTGERLVQYGKSTRWYAVEKETAFDAYGNPTFLWDRGDPADPLDDVYRCSKYANDPSAWLLGFLTETVTTDKASVGAGGECVVEGAKLAWTRSEYSGGERMNLAFERDWDDTHGSWLTTSYEYDVYGNVVARTEPETSKTTFVIDGTYHTFPEEAIDALGHHQRSRFDPRFGAAVESTDANGNVLATTLDGFGQPAESWGPDPAGKTVRLARHLQQFTKPIGQGGEYYRETRSRRDWTVGDDALWPWERDYTDGLHRVYKTLRGAAGEKEIQVDWRFDDEARATHESQPYYAGSEVLWHRLTYDEHGRLRGVTAPSRTETTTEHDIVERDGRALNRTIETVTGPDGGRLVTTSWLDARGNLLERVYTGPEGTTHPPSARYRYDRLSRPVEVTAPTGVRTETKYDSLSRVKRSTNTDGGTTTYRYLPERGLLASRQDCAGGEVAFTYDALGRETVRQLSDGQVFTFEYDQAPDPWFENTVGRMVRATSTRGGALERRDEYTYDRYDRTTGHRVTLAGGQTFTMTSAVGASGLPTSFTYPDGSVLQSKFSGLGFLASLQFTGEDKPYLQYEDYTALGQPRKAVYKNGVVSTYDYLADGRLRHTATGLGTRSYLDRTLSWNSLDAVTRIDDQLDPGRSQTFEYDGRGYLQEASSPSGYGQRSYRYDAAGNLESKDGVAYEYVRDQVRRGTRDGKEVFKAGYDCLGRMTSQERDGRTWTYRYNPDSQLLAADSSQGEGYSYAYDYLGRRSQKKSADGTITYYLYDDYELVILPDGKEQHTKYVEGLAGHIASITSSGDAVAAALAARQAAEGWRVPAQAVLALLLGLFLLAFPAATRWRARRRTA
ncbi:MAG TPA: FG-GAP-like repeat-containing protein, partial [Thermoanaerobaculia bacterium]|nr:FG-GAP-like repeat-containing protein [Thermoanaerobaculia bacterium]